MRNIFLKKIPRGIIYHTVGQSFIYFLKAFYMPLKRQYSIKKLESKFAEYCQRELCVVFPFARTAIFYLVKSLNLPKGSEVIMPAMTIKGIVDVILELELVPVYVELDPSTISFDIDDLREKLNHRVKVAIITPLFGLVPDIEKIVYLLKSNNTFVIEDFSQCLNGTFNGKRVGTFGDASVFSSSSIKTLDTLGGGFALTDDKLTYEYLRTAQLRLAAPSRIFLIKKAWINLLRNLATNNPFFTFLTFPLLQLLSRVNPSATLKQTGHRKKNKLKNLPDLWFTSFTSVQAEIGIENIKSVIVQDAERISHVEYIKTKLPNAQFPATTNKSGNVYWQLIMIVSDSQDAQKFFAKFGVDIATSSLELVSNLQSYTGYRRLLNAENIYKNGIFIPCFPKLNETDVERIINVVGMYIERNSLDAT